jgi:LysM repeat protein
VRRVGRAKAKGRRRYGPRAILIGVIAGASVFVLLAVMIVFGAYGYFQIFELILPGVKVADVDVGITSRPDAARLLAQSWEGGRGILISDGQENWVASPAEFGMSLDPAATAQRAYDVGHGGGMVEEIGVLFNSAVYGSQVAPVVSFDEAAARAGLEAWRPRLTKAPQDASIQIADGQIQAVPGVPGHELDVEGTVQAIAADPEGALRYGYLPLVLIPTAPRIADASAAVAEAETLIAAPLVVRAYDPITDQNLEWQAAPEVIAGWLGVEQTEQGPRVIVQPDRLAGWLDEVEASLGAGRTLEPEESAAEVETALREDRAATLTIRHPATTYEVQSGDTLTRIAWNTGMPYWRILEANPSIEPNTISPGDVLAIPSKDVLLPLPVIPNKRIKVSISAQRLWTYQDGALLWEFVISTGIDRSPTQPGVFQILSHEGTAFASLWNLTMPNFLAIYEAWPGFYNGFHGLPTLSDGTLLWRDVLGRRASYGCIILDLPDADTLYQWADDGVVVEIVE